MEKREQAIHDARAILDQWLPYHFYRQEIPGAAVGVVKDGELIYEGYFGHSDLETGSLVDAHTQFRIASNSKLFTATAIMQLAETNQLQLDGPVSCYLPWFTSEQDGTVEKITIRQLLFHGSGLKRDSGNYWNDDHFPTEEALRAFIQQQPTVYDTIEQFKYSNIGFGILGAVIEAITGTSYKNYVTEHILKPLHMEHTAPDIPEQHTLARGHGRKFPEKSRPVFSHISTQALQAATGFTTTVRDMASFIRAHCMDDTTILSDESKREMQRIQWLADEHTHYGLGYQIREQAGKRIYGHTGGFPGFSTYTIFEPYERLGVIVFTNVILAPTAPIAEGILRIVTECLENYSNYTSNVQAHLSQYTGTYSMRWGETYVAQINDKLITYLPIDTDPLNTCNVLRPEADNQFIIEKGSGFDVLGESVTFSISDSNTTGMRLGAFYFEKVNLVPETYNNTANTTT